MTKLMMQESLGKYVTLYLSGGHALTGNFALSEAADTVLLADNNDEVYFIKQSDVVGVGFLDH